MEKNKNALGTENGLKPIEAGDSCGCLKLSSSQGVSVFFQQIQVNQHLRHNIYDMCAFINYCNMGLDRKMCLSDLGL